MDGQETVKARDGVSAGDYQAVGPAVYGPVPSWRLGSSLGIDLLSTRGKTCSFDCVYCQLGRTVHPLRYRREFVSEPALKRELETVRGVKADYATFSGMGEPTLAVNLGRAIRLARSTLGLPVAVLTNSSLMTRKDVRAELALADVVVAKLDAPDQALLDAINRPIWPLRFVELLQGLEEMRNEYRGKLALQMMFVSTNRGSALRMAALARHLEADEVQLNTPLRPSAAPPLTRQELAEVREAFKGLHVITAYDAPPFETQPLDVEGTARRRPGRR